MPDSASTPPRLQRLLNRAVDRLFGGGSDAQTRANQRTEFWDEAVDAVGNRLSVRMTAPNIYALTVDTALEIAGHLFCRRRIVAVTSRP